MDCDEIKKLRDVTKLLQSENNNICKRLAKLKEQVNNLNVAVGSEWGKKFEAAAHTTDKPEDNSWAPGKWVEYVGQSYEAFTKGKKYQIMETKTKYGNLGIVEDDKGEGNGRKREYFRPCDPPDTYVELSEAQMNYIMNGRGLTITKIKERDGKRTAIVEDPPSKWEDVILPKSDPWEGAEWAKDGNGRVYYIGKPTTINFETTYHAIPVDEKFRRDVASYITINKRGLVPVSRVKHEPKVEYEECERSEATHFRVLPQRALLAYASYPAPLNEITFYHRVETPVADTYEEIK